MKGYGDNFKQRVIDSFKKEPEVQAQFGTDIQIIVPKITFSHRLDIVRGGPGHPHHPRRRPHGGHLGHLDARREDALRRRRGLGRPAPVHGAGQLQGVAGRLDLHPQAQGRPDRAGPRAGLRPRGHRAHVRVHPLHARPRAHVPPAGQTKQETVQTVLREVVGWFPIAPALKSKTESQIKQGIGRIWNEMDKAGKAKDKPEPEAERRRSRQKSRQYGASSERARSLRPTNCANCCDSPRSAWRTSERRSGAVKLLKDMDRIAELWPQLEARASTCGPRRALGDDPGCGRSAMPPASLPRPRAAAASKPCAGRCHPGQHGHALVVASIAKWPTSGASAFAGAVP